MIVYTDSLNFAEEILYSNKWTKVSAENVNNEIRVLTEKLLQKKDLYMCNLRTRTSWKYLLLVETALDSQFDIFIKLSQENIQLPDRILCLAKSGIGFHGFKNRSWSTEEGNIHLSAFIAPQKEVEHFSTGFLIVSAVSVIQTIDSIKELKRKAMVKWVNDILIDSSKVCGVLAYTQSQGKTITGAILGIGLNVNTTPRISPTPFVPKVASLSDFTKSKKSFNQKLIFHRLIHFLNKNIKNLLNGKYNKLLNIYIKRSLIIGKYVKVCRDTPEETVVVKYSGKVKGIGENLELILEDIEPKISNGRLIIESQDA